LGTLLSLPKEEEGMSPPRVVVRTTRCGWPLHIRCREESTPLLYPPPSLQPPSCPCLFCACFAHLRFSGRHIGKRLLQITLPFHFRISNRFGKKTQVFLGSGKIFSFEKQGRRRCCGESAMTWVGVFLLASLLKLSDSIARSRGGVVALNPVLAAHPRTVSLSTRLFFLLSLLLFYSHSLLA